MAKSPLHIEVGIQLNEIVKPNNSNNLEVRLDGTCSGLPKSEGGLSIPLFFASKANSTQLCEVDAMLLKNSKVAVVVEIEESNTKPTQICGKYLTTALSKVCSTKIDGNINIDNKIDFIQILDTSALKPKSQKPDKFKILEKAIKNEPSGCIKEYDIIDIDKNSNNFKAELKSKLCKILKKNGVI